MSILSGSKTIKQVTATVVVHTAAAQAAGYLRYQVVVHGGVAWLSLTNNNTSRPGSNGTWDMFE